MPATMKDIARITGLSIATVSKCINGQSIKEENRALIEKVIDDLGYVRDESARSMKTGRSGIIAIIVPTLEITMINVFVRECQSLLIEKGLIPVICVSEYSEKREQELVSKLKANQVDGMIIMPISKDTTRAYDYLKNHNLPFVFFDQFIPSYPSNCVAVCNNSIVDEVMAELKELGHRNISIFLGFQSLTSFDRRGAVIVKYAEKHGISCPENYIISCENSDKSVLSSIKYLLGLDPAPTAIICLTESATTGTYLALQHLGYSVPDDISLIGVKNSDIFDHISPVSLTLFNQPIPRCAKECARILFDKLMLKYDKQSVGGKSSRVDVALEFQRGETMGRAKK